MSRQTLEEEIKDTDCDHDDGEECPDNVQQVAKRVVFVNAQDATSWLQWDTFGDI